MESYRIYILLYLAYFIQHTGLLKSDLFLKKRHYTLSIILVRVLKTTKTHRKTKLRDGDHYMPTCFCLAWALP